MKKITKTTLKSFIKKNAGNLYIKNISKFSGMVDGVENVKDTFSKAKTTDQNTDFTLGIVGVYVVRGSNNGYYEYNNGEYEGIECCNSCGTFVIAKKI